MVVYVTENLKIITNSLGFLL